MGVTICCASGDGGSSDGETDGLAHVDFPSSSPNVLACVPDVAGDADPATGYQIRVDGRNAVFGGTSAVAPLWAALIAVVNQRRGRPLGYLHPLLYAAGTAPFRDITSGTNGAYAAGRGWDACTGLGSPNGQALDTVARA